jgi:hypothetical protein
MDGESSAKFRLHATGWKSKIYHQLYKSLNEESWFTRCAQSYERTLAAETRWTNSEKHPKS